MYASHSVFLSFILVYKFIFPVTIGHRPGFLLGNIQLHRILAQNFSLSDQLMGLIVQMVQEVLAKF